MNHLLSLTRMSALLLLLSVVTAAEAAPITRQQAKERAAEFLKDVPGSRQLAPVTRRAKLSPRLRAAAAVENELYYVFNRGVNQGYVIVSGDDLTLPVLGYTDEGEFDYEAIPDNMRSWLSHYEQELTQMREHPETMPANPRYAPVHDAIAPMITSQWNQGSPYNDECPLYFNQGRSVTGCVATAMAQVLYYWRKISVTETQAAIPAYDGYTAYQNSHLHVEGIPAHSPIDWDNMLDVYTSSATGIQRTAVAQLMHYCGVSVEMDYTNNSSGAQSYRVADAMRNYFGYDEKTRYVSGSDYSADAWDALLYNELAEGRPFYLSGSNDEAGHAFVCHGYDGNHCYRINWGWGGASDGWFLLTTLNPSSQGIGGSSGGYSNYPEAVIGSQPPANGTRAMAFENRNAQRACISAFDSDGDGVLTYAEAAAVTDLGSAFRGQRISVFPELYYFTGLESVSDSSFYGCSTLTSITLPKNLKDIGKAAFSGCTRLASISLPGNIQSIGEGAFSGCVKLADVALPKRISAIGARAFYGCAALTEISLPLSITNVGDSAFAGCVSLNMLEAKSLTPELITLSPSVFGDLDLSAATLICPQGTAGYYSTTAPWSAFGCVKGERNFSGARFAEMAVNTPFYLYNVGTGRFMSKGEAWGTQAVGTDEGTPMKFKLQRTAAMPSGTYQLYSDDTGKDGHLTFRTNGDSKVGSGTWACFVDGTTSNGVSAYWSVTLKEGLDYIIQTPKTATGYNVNKALGINPDHASNEACPTYGAYPDVSMTELPLNCLWRFVPYDAHEDSLYQAAKSLGELIELARMKHVSYTREQAVYDDMSSDIATLEKAQRSLRKRLGFIVFANEAVREACLSVWDINQDGELSPEEALTAEYFYSDCGFKNNKSITEFDEMLYFKNANAIFYDSFLGCSNLKRVLMPNNIEGIHRRAFLGCSSLTRVEIGTKLNFIAESAFSGCTALQEVRLSVADPAGIDVSATAFNGVDLSQVVLYVPQGSSSLYANADVWKDFGEIREMRVIPDAGFSQMAENETVYVYNLGTRSFMSRGEAYGTQAVVANTGLLYQLKRTKSMNEGLYYLESSSLASGKNILFRTSGDAEVGKGVKACFADGSLSAKAYWQLVETDSIRHIYTLQVPSTDSEHVDTLFLGTQYNHATNYTNVTSGIYYDVPYSVNPSNCQWAFIRLSDVEEVERQRANMSELRSLLALAAGQAIDVSAEQAVYDNPASADDDIRAAIDALRTKLHYIEFADERIKAICVNNWDENEDGELSREEAAAVTDISTAFRSATGVSSFEELRFFTSITAIPDEAFRNASAMQTLWIPAGVKTIGKDVFPSTSVLKYIVVQNTDAVMESETEGADHHTYFVPASLVEAYMAAPTWEKSRISAYTGQPVVTPDSISRFYGRTNPSFTFHVDGAPISGAPVMTTEAVNASPVGAYPISIEIGSIATEGVVLTPGVLNIIPSVLTITANSYTRVVGEENPEFELTIRPFRNREDASVLTAQPVIECDATKDSPAGEYEIRVYGAEAQNYTFEYVSGTLTVTNPDAVRGIYAEDRRDAIYDLTGRPVSKTNKGIYVVGGRKVVVK
ncbi:MAG: C10 family peptidase [Bacteroidaceae bacterium]|nr:C10 family peptidase [Bacteroidaceae bacterium]